jgi:hypothetical protein
LDACDLDDSGFLVCSLGFWGIAVYSSLRIRCALACKFNSKTTLVRSLNVGCALRRAYTSDFKTSPVPSWNLIKWVGHKTRESIKFKGAKESLGPNMFQDLLFTLFCRILFTQSVVKRLGNSNPSVPCNPYTLVV